jgi:hypothetical protein
MAMSEGSARIGRPAPGAGGPSLRIAIMGSGGVGGYVGSRLAAAGQDVTFIARGDHLAAIREHGLALRSALGGVLIRPAQASDNPAAIGPVDLVIFRGQALRHRGGRHRAHAAARAGLGGGHVTERSRQHRRAGPRARARSRHRRRRAHRRGDRRAGRDPPHRYHGELHVRRARRRPVGAGRRAVGCPAGSQCRSPDQRGDSARHLGQGWRSLRPSPGSPR